MKRSIVTAMTVGLLVLAALAGSAQAQASNQSAENQAVLLKQVSGEVKQLRLEVIQQAIEFQNWKIQWLQREFGLLQSERQHLGEQEQAVNQLTAEFEKQAGNAAPGQESMTKEVEAIKTSYTEKVLKELSMKQQSVLQRETELSEQMEKERQRLQELYGKAKK